MESDSVTAQLRADTRSHFFFFKSHITPGNYTCQGSEAGNYGCLEPWGQGSVREKRLGESRLGFGD